MHAWIKIALTLPLFALLAGCTSHYVIATKEGQMLLTQGKPDLDAHTGIVTYTDENGEQHQVNNSDISQIIER